MCCRVCRCEVPPAEESDYSTCARCMPTLRRQFYAELHRYRRQHPRERMDWTTPV